MKTLIVDDDRVCCELLKEILSPYGSCDTAPDGNEAADAVRLAIEAGSPYDLVCLDIMMPGTSGHEALDTIRKIEFEHGIQGLDGTKVIMTTALDDSKHCIRAFREGCESYLTKPIDEGRLLAEVSRLLGDLAPSFPSTEDRSPVARSGPENTERPRHPCAKSRYLIVDDDRLCRELLWAMLKPFGRCDFVHDGQESIEAVRLALEEGDPYELICLDIMMPGMSGHTALEEVRKLEAEHGVYGSDGVRVIMTTALNDSKHCIQAFREGCESYLTKPIQEARLLETMRELGLLECSQCSTE